MGKSTGRAQCSNACCSTSRPQTTDQLLVPLTRRRTGAETAASRIVPRPGPLRHACITGVRRKVQGPLIPPPGQCGSPAAGVKPLCGRKTTTHAGQRPWAEVQGERTREDGLDFRLRLTWLAAIRGGGLAGKTTSPRCAQPKAQRRDCPAPLRTRGYRPAPLRCMATAVSDSRC